MNSYESIRAFTGWGFCLCSCLTLFLYSSQNPQNYQNSRPCIAPLHLYNLRLGAVDYLKALMLLKSPKLPAYCLARLIPFLYRQWVLPLRFFFEGHKLSQG